MNEYACSCTTTDKKKKSFGSTSEYDIFKVVLRCVTGGVIGPVVAVVAVKYMRTLRTVCPSHDFASLELAGAGSVGRRGLSNYFSVVFVFFLFCYYYVVCEAQHY